MIVVGLLGLITFCRTDGKVWVCPFLLMTPFLWELTAQSYSDSMTGQPCTLDPILSPTSSIISSLRRKKQLKFITQGLSQPLTHFLHVSGHAGMRTVTCNLLGSVINSPCFLQQSGCQGPGRHFIQLLSLLA